MTYELRSLVTFDDVSVFFMTKPLVLSWHVTNFFREVVLLHQKIWHTAMEIACTGEHYLFYSILCVQQIVLSSVIGVKY